MDSNTYSARHPGRHAARGPAGPSAGQPTGQAAGQAAGESAGPPDGLAALTAVVDQLAAQDLNGLPDPVRAERVLGLRRLLDRLEGRWLGELAAVDARGAAGADQGLQAASTAGWLRARLRMGAGAATSSVRTARAQFRGPLTATAHALTDGAISPTHAAVLAVGTHDLPAYTAAAAEPVLLAAARRLDPPRLRRVLGHLRLVADPEGAERRTERLHERRGLWLAPTLAGMVAVDGLLEPEAGQTLLSALEPLARPHSANDERSGGQRRADALGELARRALEGGRLPQTGGIRPQLTVTVDLDSLLDPHGSLGGEIGWAGPLDPEACRRLACDGAVTRVLVTRHPGGHHGHDHSSGHHGHDPGTTAIRARTTLVATTASMTPVAMVTTTPAGTTPPTTSPARGAWPSGCGPRPLGSPWSWAGPPPSPWRWGGPAGSSRPRSGRRWPCATAAVSSPTVRGPWPGARPTICATGCTAAPPTWPTWPCCAGPITGRCMRAAGGSSGSPTGG